MARTGRPSKFKQEFCEQAKKLAARGFTDAEVADFFEVSRSTLYKWAQENKTFSDALNAGSEDCDKRVERSLFERAVGYRHPDVHVSSYQGDVTLTPIEKVYPPDPTAMIFWLKNRQPARWRDLQKVDLSGQVNVPGLTEALRAARQRVQNSKAAA